MITIHPSEITPEHLYLNRRKLMQGAGLAAGALALSACVPAQSNTGPEPTAAATTVPRPDSTATPAPTAVSGVDAPFASTQTDELGDKLNSFDQITHYNNFYEFSTDKEAVAVLSENFRTSPWAVEVGGLVRNPKVYDIDDLRNFTQEERIYRLRCVEAWSMVIPWVGFPIAQLLGEVEPLSTAKYVRFETLYDPDQMPGQRSRWYTWPYVEGLRMDEAMHNLAILATGIYGLPLQPANGAPVRLVVPWKYGFKSIKSIVKIELVEEMPTSLWMAAAPNEYGFYANVNPEVNHPRWSQASERRIGELQRRATLMFNGYAEEVAHLYHGMDLSKFY